MSDKVSLVRVLTSATGNSTPITLGARYSDLFMTPAEAGAQDGRTYTWLIVDGNNWELVKGVYTASGTTAARTTVLASRNAGTLGTSRITLSGTAQVRIIESAVDMDGVRGTRSVAGTSDSLASTDLGYVVTYGNAAAVAVSLAAAGTASLYDGWATWVQNLGVGTVTITPTTSTINGNATLPLATNMGAFIWSDGTNYHAYFVPVSKPLLAANNGSDFANVDTTLVHLRGLSTDNVQSLTPTQRGIAAANLQFVAPPQGRLTLATGTPVMPLNQSAKTTVFYTPYVGNQCPLYDGTNMIPTIFGELTALTTDTTKSPAAIGASKVNDWFVWNDGGTIRLSHGPDWTNDTTRSAGTAIAAVFGIQLNSVAITNGPAASRGTWVGTTRSNASSQLDWILGASASGGSPAFLGVWNAYNRVSTAVTVVDVGTGYTYTSNTPRQARASAGNQITQVVGAPENAITASYASRGDTSGAMFAIVTYGLGFNSSSTFAGQPAQVVAQTAIVMSLGGGVTQSLQPQLGVNTVYAVERGDNANANTFNASSIATLTATVWH